MLLSSFYRKVLIFFTVIFFCCKMIFAQYNVNVAFHRITNDVNTVETDAGFASTCTGVIQELNNAYSGTVNYSFAFSKLYIVDAGHVNANYIPSDFTSTKESDRMLKNYARLNTNQYLNIWVVDGLGSSSSVNNCNSGTTTDFIRGYVAYKLSSSHGTYHDGIVIAAPQFDLAGVSTVVHELGHYFGLLHLDSDLDASNLGGDMTRLLNGVCDETNGLLHGDLVPDTPPTENHTCLEYCCETNNSCNSTYPNFNINTAENYMLSPLTVDIGERQSFTSGQLLRVEAMFNEHRTSLNTNYGSVEILNPFGASPKTASLEVKSTSLHNLRYFDESVLIPQENYIGGEIVNIAWRDDSNRSLDIYYAEDGVNFSRIFENISSNVGINTIEWIVPSDESLLCRLELKEHNSNIPIHTTNPFVIATTGGATFLRYTNALFGQQLLNNFDAPFESNATGTVKVELSTDGGATYTTINSAFPISGATNNYDDVISNAGWITSNAQLKISLNSDPTIYDISTPFPISCGSIITNPSNAPVLGTTSNEICNASSNNIDPLINISSSVVSAGFYYQWQLNGVDILQNTGQTIHANDYGVGTYTAYITDGAYCNSAMSNSLVISDTYCTGTSGAYCATPQNVIQYVPEPYRITIGWDEVTDASGFMLRYREQGTSTWTTINIAGTGTANCGGGTCSYNINGLAPSKIYEVQVKTTCLDSTHTNWSSSLLATTSAASPNFCNSPTYTSEIGIVDDGSGTALLPYGGPNGDGTGYICQYTVAPQCPIGESLNGISIQFTSFSFIAYNPTLYRGQYIEIFDGNTSQNFAMSGSVGIPYTPITGAEVLYFNTPVIAVYMHNPYPNTYINGFTFEYEADCVCNLPTTPNVIATNTEICDSENETAQFEAFAVDNSGVYSYQWQKNGKDIVGANNAVFNTQEDGIYSVYMTNFGDCSTISSDTTSVTHSLEVCIESTVQSCDTNNGTASVIVQDDTQIVDIQWDSNTGNQSGTVASGLLTGLYDVTVTDINGCTAIMPAKVHDTLEIIINVEPVVNNQFGTSVAVSDSLIFIGNPFDSFCGTNTGSVSVYKLKNSFWTEINRIYPDDADPNQLFGQSIDYSNGILAVGAPYYNEVGAVYIFDIDDDEATLIQTLEEQIPQHNDRFGISLDIDNTNPDLIAVGSKGTATGYLPGKVIVFRKTGTQYIEEQFLAITTGNYFGGNNDFGVGEAVVIEGNYLFYSARRRQINYCFGGASLGEIRGSIQACKYNGTYWEGNLNCNTTIWGSVTGDSSLGTSLAIDGNRLLVGHIWGNVGGTTAGKVYVYKFNSIYNLPLEQILTASDPAYADYFGQSVAIKGEKIVVGASRDDGSVTNGGSVYEFELDGTTWVETNKFSSFTTSGVADFGADVAFNDDCIVVAAPFDALNTSGHNKYGAVYVYKQRGISGDADLDGICDNMDLCPYVFSTNNNTSSIELSPKVFLQGAMTGTTMHSNLGAVIPMSEPYSDLNYTHVNGGGGETTTATIMSVTGSKAVVDWVVVELRAASDASSVLATRSALLLRDGTVVDMDGVSAVCFPNIGVGNYYVAIRHRNHLSVMTNTAITLN